MDQLTCSRRKQHICMLANLGQSENLAFSKIESTTHNCIRYHPQTETYRGFSITGLIHGALHLREN